MATNNSDLLYTLRPYVNTTQGVTQRAWRDVIARLEAGDTIIQVYNRYSGYAEFRTGSGKIAARNVCRILIQHIRGA